MPFDKWILDSVGPIATSRSNRFMVTSQDELTKYAECVATPQITAWHVGKILVESIICRYGIPQTIMSDLGSNFTSDVFKEVCKLLKIRHITATVAHPLTVGQIERYHRTLASFMKIYAGTEKDDWDDWIPYALYVYNTTKHASTNFSPHYLLHGVEAEIPKNIRQNTHVV